MAEVQRLQPFQYLSLIGTYAERFALNPDWVFSNVSFDTVINFNMLWKESREFDERYNEAEKLMTQSPS